MPPPYDASAHATAVAEIHDALLHAVASSSDAVGEGSFALKFTPESDTEAPPVGAMFDGLTKLIAGAATNHCTMLSAARCGRTKRSMCAPSKLSDPTPVPTTAATDRAVHPVPPPYDADAHVTVVPDVHDALLHANISTSDGVGSCELKFSPESDTEAPPVGAMFDGPA